mgnify:CR=1 FL=1
MKGISLFSSAGIAETYLKDCGIEMVCACELLQRRAELHKWLYPDCEMVCGDITNESIYNKVKKEALDNDCKFLLATPPCQGMSSLGKKDYDNDKRNYLIFYAMDMIDECNFDYILIENVPKFLQLYFPYKGELKLLVDIFKDKYSSKYEIDSFILNAKDYFRLEDKGIENIMQKAVFPAYFVPDTIKADDLFRNMKREKNALAVVLDEYGGLTGIITINDLVEQLVGELVDDEEEEAFLIEEIEENTWKIHGSAALEDVSEALGVSLCSEEYDTFNGLIFHRLQSVPESGANIELEFMGLKIKVIEIANHQVETAIVEKRKSV